jgi:UDP-glucose 4-epimerase
LNPSGEVSAMSVLITGGSGLIGTFVSEALLDRGEEVVVYDLKPPKNRADVEFVKGTVTDRESLIQVCTSKGVDRIVHLASVLQFACEEKPDLALQVNVLGTSHLLDAARAVKAKRFVFASSGAMYGPVRGEITETTPISQEVGLYGAAKHLCESLGFRYHKVYGVPFVALRYWGVYGPGEVSSPGMAEVFKKIESTITGRDVEIHEVGAEEKRHFTFVKDAAHATLLAMESPLTGPRAFNIAGSDDSYVSFREFHETIKKLWPAAGNVRFLGKGQDRGRVRIHAAKKELGYEPQYTLEMGLREDIVHWQGGSKDRPHNLMGGQDESIH